MKDLFHELETDLCHYFRALVLARSSRYEQTQCSSEQTGLPQGEVPRSTLQSSSADVRQAGALTRRAPGGTTLSSRHISCSSLSCCSSCPPASSTASAATSSNVNSASRPFAVAQLNKMMDGTPNMGKLHFYTCNGKANAASGTFNDMRTASL